MTRQTISTDAVPRSPLYAQAVRAGDTVHVSGTVGVDVATGLPTGPTIEAQLRQAVANCAAVLAAAGASLDDVVEVGVLLADPDDFPAMNAAYAELFPHDPPARYVAKLGANVPGILVSVRMTAWAPVVTAPR